MYDVLSRNTNSGSLTLVALRPGNVPRLQRSLATGGDDDGIQSSKRFRRLQCRDQVATLGRGMILNDQPVAIGSKALSSGSQVMRVDSAGRIGPLKLSDLRLDLIPNDGVLGGHEIQYGPIGEFAILLGSPLRHPLSRSGLLAFGLDLAPNVVVLPVGENRAVSRKLSTGPLPALPMRQIRVRKAVRAASGTSRSPRPTPTERSGLYEPWWSEPPVATRPWRPARAASPARSSGE